MMLYGCAARFEHAGMPLILSSNANSAKCHVFILFVADALDNLDASLDGAAQQLNLTRPAY
jgi:hypothetical protein